jgi:AcrR family transcriptional regulator
METESAAMTQLDLPPQQESTGAAPRGRRRDHTRDPEILSAALEVLAEHGYEGMTVEMVAARAKAGKATLYRRWSSKGELVIDAISCMKRDEAAGASLPDTGTLRGDLIAMIKPPSIVESERKMQIMAGLVSMLATSPDLSAAANAAIVDPRAAVNRLFLTRAIDRGEIRPDCDIETLALILPSMTAYRVLMLRKPVDRAFLIGLIDGVLLPAAGIGPDGTSVHAGVSAP